MALTAASSFARRVHLPLRDQHSGGTHGQTHIQGQVAGVAVYINPKGVVKTDMRGRFVIDGAFNSVTLVRQGYESLTLERSEMTDSIWMLPNGRSLDEVVIIGHRPKLGFSTKDKKFDKYNLPRNNSLIGGFDFFESLNFKKQKQKKRREKIKKILDKY